MFKYYLPIKKTVACNMIEELRPREAWIQVYTDGSATRAVKNGGARVWVCLDKESEATCLPTEHSAHILC